MKPHDDMTVEVASHDDDGKAIDRSELIDTSPLQEDWMGQFWDCNSKDKEVPPGYMEDFDDDDVSRASSTNYFSQEDFVGWQSSYIPPMGFAVFLGGLVVVVHPVLWVAGALTAVGTVKVCLANDDICGEGLFSKFKEQKEEPVRRETQQNETKQTETKRLLLPSPIVEGNATADESSKKEVIAGKTEDVQQGTSSIQPPKTGPQHPSELETPQEALDWINLHYPPMTECAKENVTLAGLNALEFFDVFFANDAPFTFAELQRKRQDKNIEYGKWQELENIQQASLHPKSAESVDIAMQERILTFKTKTNSFFGPPYANATKKQRALVASKKLLVLEATTILKEVPFCDRFYITERWIVTAEKVDQVYHSSLSIYYEVIFKESCPFESQIVSSSKKTFLEIANTWITMARQALKLTEEARTKRLEQTEAGGTGESSQRSPELGIEVQHTGKGRSSIVNDNDAVGDVPTPLKLGKMVSFRRNMSKMGHLPRMLHKKMSTLSTNSASTSPSSSFSS
eukprot:scaffold22575_cov141-Cylindrotheca_fusiformis.AAC.30